MIISAPISLGELIDKISILLIKKEKITDESKNNHISNELNKLQEILNNSSIDKFRVFFTVEIIPPPLFAISS